MSEGLAGFTQGLSQTLDLAGPEARRLQREQQGQQFNEQMSLQKKDYQSRLAAAGLMEDYQGRVMADPFSPTQKAAALDAEGKTVDIQGKRLSIKEQEANAKFLDTPNEQFGGKTPREMQVLSGVKSTVSAARKGEIDVATGEKELLAWDARFKTNQDMAAAQLEALNLGNDRTKRLTPVEVESLVSRIATEKETVAQGRERLGLEKDAASLSKERFGLEKTTSEFQRKMAERESTRADLKMKIDAANLDEERKFRATSLLAELSKSQAQVNADAARLFIEARGVGATPDEVAQAYTDAEEVSGPLTDLQIQVGHLLSDNDPSNDERAQSMLDMVNGSLAEMASKPGDMKARETFKGLADAAHRFLSGITGVKPAAEAPASRPTQGKPIGKAKSNPAAAVVAAAEARKKAAEERKSLGKKATEGLPGYTPSQDETTRKNQAALTKSIAAVMPSLRDDAEKDALRGVVGAATAKDARELLNKKQPGHWYVSDTGAVVRIPTFSEMEKQINTKGSNYTGTSLHRVFGGQVWPEEPRAKESLNHLSKHYEDVVSAYVKDGTLPASTDPFAPATVNKVADLLIRENLVQESENGFLRLFQ